MHISPGHYRKRDDSNPLVVPSAQGIGAVTSVGPDVPSPTTLLVSNDPSSPTNAPDIPLVAGSSVVDVPTGTISSATPGPTGAPASHVADSPTTASTSHGLSTGAVVGVIIAAFLGAFALIFLAYYFLRRSWQNAIDKSVASASKARGAHPSKQDGHHRSASRGQPWNKLDDDGQDRWEGREKPSAPPATADSDSLSARLDLFRKPSSTRSDVSPAAPERLNQFDPSTMPNFAKYHPDLAVELATAPQPPHAPFAKPSAFGHHPSWSDGGSTLAGTEPYLSVRISDSLATPLVKQTPTATATPVTLARWESAEVLTMDDDGSTAGVRSPGALATPRSPPSANPFLDPADARRSRRVNPFFNAQTAAHDPFADPARRSVAAIVVEAPEDEPRESTSSLALLASAAAAVVEMPAPTPRGSTVGSRAASPVSPTSAGTPGLRVRPDSPTSPEVPQTARAQARAMRNLLAVLSAGPEADSYGGDARPMSLMSGDLSLNAV